MAAQPIPSRALLQYGFIALPIAFAGFPLYVLAPDFYATRYGLSLTLMGVLLLAIRLIDAIQDPLIGWFTDRLQGRFRAAAAGACLVLCLAVFGLFNTLFFTPALWFTFCMILAVSAYSLLTIVLGAQATLWTTDRNDQTRIAGAREAFGLVGLVVAVSMPTLLAPYTDSAHAFLWYSACLAILMLAGFGAFSRLLRGLPLMRRDTSLAKTALLAGLRAISPFSRRLLLVYGMSMLASSIPAVLVIFYVRDYLDAEHHTGLFLLLYFLSGAVGMPLWRKLSGHIGKSAAWGVAHLVAVAGFIAAFFLSAGDIWVYGVVCAVSGLALGADLTIPPSLLADGIHAQGHQRFAGTHFAALAFIAKASLALASAITLPLLDAAGFRPQSANTESARAALALAYALIPCGLKLVSAGLLYACLIRSYPGGSNDDTQNPGHFRSTHHV